MSVRTKLFLILFSAGLLGVFSILLIDVASLIAILPLPAGIQIPQFNWGLKLLSLLQPSIFLFIAVLVGVGLAARVGLGAPVAAAAAQGTNLISPLRPQIIPGIVGGLTGGAAIVLSSLLWKPFLATDVVALISQFGKLTPLPTRLLYGGITEELLLRWGLMTLLVWLGWRLIQKGKDVPKPTYFIAAIVISSVVFGAAHLPIAFMLFHQPTVALVAFVIVANSLFGLIAGYLYWKKGLESAMIAHMLTHLVMFTANYFGAYF